MLSLNLHGAGISGVLVLVAVAACGRPELRSEPIGASDDTQRDLGAAVQLHADAVMTEALQSRNVQMSAPAETELSRDEPLAVIDLGDLDDDDAIHTDKPNMSFDPRAGSESSKAKTAPMTGPGDDTARPPRSAAEAAERSGGTNRRALEGPTPASPTASPRDWAPPTLSPTVPVETTPNR